MQDRPTRGDLSSYYDSLYKIWKQAGGRSRTDEGSDSDEPLPEECSLPFDEQIENLKAAYSDTAFEKYPPLPPYTSEEVSAMEAKYFISFPPLFRYYIENISRDTSFTFYRSLVQPEECGSRYKITKMKREDYCDFCEFYGSNGEPQSSGCEESCEAERNQGNGEPHTRSSHVADNGCAYDETIRFSGRLCGYVQLAEEMYPPHIRTLYERLIDANPDDGLIEGSYRDPGPTLEETLLRCRDDEFSKAIEEDFGELGVLNEIKDVELPDELKVCRRETMEAVSIILGHTRIGKWSRNSVLLLSRFV